MVQTPISGSSAFCTAEQLLAVHDWNNVADLLSDRPQNATPTSSYKLTRAQVLTSTDLNFLLKANSGYVEAACFVGGRYTTADLEALAGTNAGNMLAELVADLTMADLYDRKDRKGETPPRCLQAMQLLVTLEQGEKIFPFQESADAGRLDSERSRHAPIVRTMGRFFGSAADPFVDGREDARDNF